MQPNEAEAFKGLIGETEWSQVRGIDSLRSLTMYSRSAQDGRDILGVVDVNTHSRRRRPVATPATRSSGSRRTSAIVGASRLTAFGVVLVVGVAALGGVSAGVVITFGPYSKSLHSPSSSTITDSSSGLLSWAIWAAVWPILQLVELVQCKFHSLEHPQGLTATQTGVRSF